MNHNKSASHLLLTPLKIVVIAKRMRLSKNSSKKPEVKFDFISPSAKADGNSERMIIKLPSDLAKNLAQDKIAVSFS